MPGNAFRRPNQPASGPAVASIFLGFGRMYTDDQQDSGPKYRGTDTTSSWRCTCLDSYPDGDMVPSPLGRGLPSRHGFGKSL